jgi:anti-sigma factor ChrR (cupin superfamily)
MDILAQVAQGGTTPAQVIATAADLKGLTDAATKAAAACSAMNGTVDHSVVSPTTVTQAASDAIAVAVQAGSIVMPALYDSGALSGP